MNVCLEGFDLGRSYNLETGYITVPDANKIVLRVLGIVNKEDKTYYNKILSDAKKGKYGGKLHGKRIYQVRKDDIMQYAEELLHAEKLKLFKLEFAKNTEEVERLGKLPEIDSETAAKLYYYLRTLRFHEIISSGTHQNAEKQLMLRVSMGRFSHV